MKDILNAVAKTRRALLKKYPGASAEAIEGAVKEMVNVALMDPKADPADAAALFDASVNTAQDDWAEELSGIFLEKSVRPEYEKAIEAEVDPIALVRAYCGLSEEDARKAIAKLIERHTVKPADPFRVMAASAPSQDADEPETAQV